MKSEQGLSGVCGTAESEKNTITGNNYGNTGINRDVISSLKEGSPEAFKTVYMTYHTPLERFLSALLRSRPEAEEFAQEIMLEIWEKRSQLDPSRNIGGLIYTMAKRKAFDCIRHRYVEKKYVDEKSSGHGDEFSISGEELAIASETEILQEFILSRMSERRRRIYELSRNEGLTYEEIARELDISQKTVEYHISQALKEFRQVLSLFMILITISQ